MAHRRLREPERGGEVANTRFAVRVRSDQAQESKSSRVGKYAERSCEPHRLLLSKRGRQNLRTTLGIDESDLAHGEILTVVDVSVNVSSDIDAIQRREVNA